MPQYTTLVITSATDCTLFPLAYRQTLLSFVSSFVRTGDCSWLLKTSCVSRFVTRALFVRSLPNLHCSFKQWKQFHRILSLFNDTIIYESSSVARKTAFPIDAILKIYKMAQKGTPDMTSQTITSPCTFHRVMWTGLFKIWSTKISNQCDCGRPSEGGANRIWRVQTTSW